MLGMLGMTINECMQAYREFASQVFTRESTSNSTMAIPFGPVFSAGCLEDAIKSTIKKYCPENECKDRRHGDLSTAAACPHQNMPFRDGTCTKTYVRFQQK